MKTRTLLLVCILVILLCTQADAKIIYVDDDASGANNGSSWQNAYIYLQDALTETENLENPALVLVAQGIYYPDLGGKIKPRDNAASFYLTEGVKLCGGYAGIACPDPNARDVQQYETILCGNDNTYRVVTAKAVNSDTIIDGFTITSSKDTYSSGGGIYLRENGNITVRNCLFYFNETHGIYSESSSPTVTGCTFENNNGGIFIRYGNAKITDCMFTNNTSSLGGGIYCIETLLYLENCIFMRNKVIKVCYCSSLL